MVTNVLQLKTLNLQTGSVNEIGHLKQQKEIIKFCDILVFPHKTNIMHDT